MEDENKKDIESLVARKLGSVLLNRKQWPLLLCLITLLWMLAIFLLSSQNGEQTAKASGGLAQTIAGILYRQPTEQQVDQVHIVLRKIAHIGLFFVLGLLSYAAASNTLGRLRPNKRWPSLVLAMALTSACGFFDEWHKQFIDGRHFDAGETLLNMACGILGVLLAFAAGLWMLQRKNKRQCPDTAAGN